MAQFSSIFNRARQLLFWAFFVGFLYFRVQGAYAGWLYSEPAVNFSENGNRKIHLHTDRTFYVPGDTIWYKAYLADATSLKPVKQKEILTVAVYNAARKVVCSQKLQTKEGLGAAQLALPDTLRSGNYALVAYSNALKQVGDRPVFQKTLVVFRPEKPLGIEKLTPADQQLATLEFFPEGGALVEGMESRIGFKATTAAGIGLAVEGQILDNNGKIAGTFKADQTGISSFLFRPQKNSTYTVKIAKPQFAEGTKVALPAVRQEGVTMQVTSNSDSVFVIKILGTPAMANFQYGLNIQSGGKTWFSEDITLDGQATAVRQISNKQFPRGIAQISLLHKNVMVAERIVYVPGQVLNLKLSTNKSRYGRKEPVTVQLEARNQQGKPVQAEVSVAVTDLNQNDQLYTNPTIFSSLQNKASLPITNAAPYFKDNTLATRKALDDLLLTMNGRQLSLNKENATQEQNVKTAQDQELSLQGTVLTEKGEPLNKAIVFLLELETGKADLVTANEAGAFTYPVKSELAGYRFLYQVWHQGAFQKQATVVTKADTLTTFPEWVGPALNKAGSNKLILQAGILKQFRDANSSAPETENFSQNWAAKPADRVYQLINYSEFQDVEEVFKEIVPSIRIRTKQNQTESRVINPATKKFNPNQPLYLIDGQPTFNGDLVLRMNADLVQEISVYFTPEKLQPFGFIGNQGVVAIRTKAGNFSSAELSNNIIALPGLVKERTFKISGTEGVAPDFRPTLFWNPWVKTDAAGRATITFPTSDAASRFSIEVEGITSDGAIGREVIDFETVPAQ